MKATLFLLMALLVFIGTLPCIYHAHAADTYLYTLMGPYREAYAGGPYTGNITVWMTLHNSAPLGFNMSNGETLPISSSEPAISMTWNITSDGSRQRRYYFTYGENATVRLYVPDDTDVVADYYVSVADFAGVTNAYLNVERIIIGVTRVLERTSLDVMTSTPFWLVTTVNYLLEIDCDQGDWTFALPADALQVHNYVITKDMAESNVSATDITITVTRMSAQTITVEYDDGNNSTTTVLVNITKSDGALVYSNSSLGNSLTFIYDTADPSSSYLVDVNAVVGGTGYDWNFTVGVYETSYNPLTGLYFPHSILSMTGVFAVFGSSAPIITNAVGMFLVALVFAVGEWRDAEEFTFFALLIALFEVAIQWLSIPIAGIAMAGVVVAAMYIHRGKRTEREV